MKTQNDNNRIKYHHGLHFDYPKETDAHMINPKQVRNVDLDDHYQYYSRSMWLRFWQNMTNVLFVILIYFSNYVRYGLKIKGRKYKHGKYRKYYKNGFITTCNHVFEWDYICVRSAMRCRRGYVTVWKKNNDSSLGKLMRVVGSVPISTSINGLVRFSSDIDKMLKNGEWIHFYPEGSMWYYNEAIRPYKKGAFVFAYRNSVPLYPLAISYRPARGIWKLWKHDYPCITIEIGEPMFIDYSFNKNDAIEKLRSEVETKTRAMMEKNTPFVVK